MALSQSTLRGSDRDDPHQHEVRTSIWPHVRVVVLAQVVAADITFAIVAYRADWSRLGIVNTGTAVAILTGIAGASMRGAGDRDPTARVRWPCVRQPAPRHCAHAACCALLMLIVVADQASK